MVSVKTKPVSAGEIINQKKNYNGIDLMKFICSILVFMIHVKLFGDNSFSYAGTINYGLQQGLCRVAVPFFFVASGFFLFKKMDLYNVKTDVIKSYCFRILQLFGLWSVLLVVGGKYHLWYMGATVVAIVLLSICLNKFRMRLAYICSVAVLLYIIGLMCGTYVKIFEPLNNIAVFRYITSFYDYFFNGVRNGVFFGFVFVLMGALFAHRENKLTVGKALAGLIVSVVGLLTEAFLVRRYVGNKGNDMYLFLLPVAFFLFSFAMNVKLKDRPIYRKLRTIGVLVYFTHLFVKEVSHLLKKAIEYIIGFDITPYAFLVILVLTLLISFFIEWLSHKEKFKWINWLL